MTRARTRRFVFRGLIGFIILVALALLALNRPQSLDTNQITLAVLIFLTILWLVTVYVGLRNRTGSRRQWLTDYSKDISPELFGAILTTILFTVIVGSTQQSQVEDELKAQLIRQLGSRVNGEAIRAAEELAAHNWAYDGTLEGVVLTQANLQNADLDLFHFYDVRLNGANLQGASLYQAFLYQADLTLANLQDARLDMADLERADLEGANLQDANLHRAYLRGAVLIWADLGNVYIVGTFLQGANLEGANLQDAHIGSSIDERGLRETAFDGATILPDGSHWTPDTDMTHFTDPNHPNFWRSDNPASPAYATPSS